MVNSIQLVKQERLNATGPWAYKPVSGVDETSGISDAQKVILTGPDGKIHLSFLPPTLPNQSGQAGKFLTTDGSTSSWASPFPTFVSGKVLSNNGSTLTWIDPPTPLPAYAGLSDKYLKVDGGNLSWSTAPDPLPSRIGKNGLFLTTDGVTLSWSNTPVYFSNPMTAKGDLIVALDGGGGSRLPIGANGLVLTVVNGTAAWQSLPSSLPSMTGNSGKFLTTNGSSALWGDVPAELPTRTGNAGKYLTTDGTNVTWSTVSAGASLPTQTGNAGKVLMTDGANPYWGTSGGASLPTQTDNAGKFLTTDGTTAYWGTPTGSSNTVIPNVLVGTTTVRGATVTTDVVVATGSFDPTVAGYTLLISQSWTPKKVGDTLKLTFTFDSYNASNTTGVGIFADGVLVGSVNYFGDSGISGITRNYTVTSLSPVVISVRARTTGSNTTIRLATSYLEIEEYDPSYVAPAAAGSVIQSTPIMVNQAGPLPQEGNWTSLGGPAQLHVSGQIYYSSAKHGNVTVKLDGVVVATIQTPMWGTYHNWAFDRTFPVWTTAGSHVVRLETDVTSDGNNRYNVTALETYVPAVPIDRGPSGWEINTPMVQGEILGTAWSQDNYGGLTIASVNSQLGNNALKFTLTDAANTFRGVRVPVPTLPFRVVTHLRLESSAQYHDLGIGFTATGSTHGFYFVGLPGWARGAVDHWWGSSLSAYVGASQTSGTYLGDTAILALDVNSTGVTSWVWNGSSDSWYQVGSLSFTPTHMGLYMKSQSGSQAVGYFNSLYTRSYGDMRPPREVSGNSRVSTRGSILQSQTFPAASVTVAQSPTDSTVTLLSQVTVVPKKVGSILEVEGSVRWGAPTVAGHARILVKFGSYTPGSSSVGVQAGFMASQPVKCRFTTTSLDPITVGIYGRKDSSADQVAEVLSAFPVTLVELDDTSAIIPGAAGDAVISLSNERPWRGFVTPYASLTQSNWGSPATTKTDLQGGAIRLDFASGGRTAATLVKYFDKTKTVLLTTRLKQNITNAYNFFGNTVTNSDNTRRRLMGILHNGSTIATTMEDNDDSSAYPITNTALATLDSYNLSNPLWWRTLYSPEFIATAISSDGYRWSWVRVSQASASTFSYPMNGSTVGIGVAGTPISGSAFSGVISHFELEETLDNFPASIQPTYTVGSETLSLTRAGSILNGSLGADLIASGSISGPLAVLNMASGKRHTCLFEPDGSAVYVSTYTP